MPSISEKGESIAFLDTSNTVLKTGQIDVTVHRKDTHTEKYLSFDSHHPKQSKVAVVKTLLDRAATIPSNASKKKSVLKDLKTNGYTLNFIGDVSERSRNRTDIDQQRGEPKEHTSIPYHTGKVYIYI